MNRFISVELSEHGDESHQSESRRKIGCRLRDPDVPALTMTIVTATGTYVAVASALPHALLNAGSVDEHLAVDLDAGKAQSQLDCADVLHGSRPQPTAEALRRLTAVTAAHRGCLLAAIPLIGGGWAVMTSEDLCLVTCRTTRSSTRAEQSLFPSCIHAWLVAGHSLRELESATVVLHS
ncbi:hypothetical protein ACWGDX_30265 [Streptomyces sp. NPDC055025]